MDNVRKVSNANSPMILALRGRERRLTSTVTNVMEMWVRASPSCVTSVDIARGKNLASLVVGLGRGKFSHGRFLIQL